MKLALAVLCEWFSFETGSLDESGAHQLLDMQVGKNPPASNSPFLGLE